MVKDASILCDWDEIYPLTHLGDDGFTEGIVWIFPEKLVRRLLVAAQKANTNSDPN